MIELGDAHIKKYPIPTTQEEDVQQALGILWTQFEQGVTRKADLEKVLEGAVRPGILDQLILENFVFEREGLLELTSKGQNIARDMARRHLLTERLLKDVLVLPKEQIDPNACRMEHVITPDVEEAICILLGHPRACPHGLAIPQGKCCEEALGQTGPVVVSLSALKSGQEAGIAYFSSQDRPELHKLLSLGLSPGNSVRVVQTFPAFVVSLGESLLALEDSLASHIFVRKKNGK
ncbi:MAG: metal-dependent transcriptional regulator [Elusimicrobia bacterium]|nr:metal-dependent transcriptional regulator [Elusimicrobiota bacterium]